MAKGKPAELNLDQHKPFLGEQGRVVHRIIEWLRYLAEQAGGASVSNTTIVLGGSSATTITAANLLQVPNPNGLLVGELCYVSGGAAVRASASTHAAWFVVVSTSGPNAFLTNCIASAKVLLDGQGEGDRVWLSGTAGRGTLLEPSTGGHLAQVIGAKLGNGVSGLVDCAVNILYDERLL